MSNKRKQYYVVVNGRKPGIYSKWFGAGEANEQVEKFEWLKQTLRKPRLSKAVSAFK